jgi:hypothetical protein
LTALTLFLSVSVPKPDPGVIPHTLARALQLFRHHLARCIDQNSGTNTMKKTISIFAGLFAAGGSLLFGQEHSRFTFDVGAGFVESVGSTRTELDKTGWNVEGGAGIALYKGLGVKLDVAYNSFGINGATLGNIGVPGGDVGIFTALVNPVYHVGGIRHVDFYVTGGGGLFRQRQEFTQPALATTQMLSSYSVNKPGYDVGAGFELGTKWHGKVFAEARYEHMFNTDSHTDFIPVTFGFRW